MNATLCADCRKPLPEPVTAGQRFCSGACKQRAYRQRKAGKAGNATSAAPRAVTAVPGPVTAESSREAGAVAADAAGPERAEPYISALARGLGASGLLPVPGRAGHQVTAGHAIALPAGPAPSAAIGNGGRSQSQVILDCVQGNHPWMPPSADGISACVRAPDCGAVRIDLYMRTADGSRNGPRYAYEGTAARDNPAVRQAPRLPRERATYLISSTTGRRKHCPRNVCNDTLGQKCPHQ